MSRRVEISLHVANALQYLGQLYRSPADALKEHVSNALDEHKKAESRFGALPPCKVLFELEKKSITIRYPYGMNRAEFEQALRRVADSAKRKSSVPQIGQLGIGMFSFQQVGKKCTFFTKKSAEDETLRVTLREGHETAEFDTAGKREALESPGIRIVIGELKSDPTKARGPVSAERLAKKFGELFARDLRDKRLEIEIRRGQEVIRVEPPPIDLPSISEGLEDLTVPGLPGARVKFELYFDPSAQGVVSIRHTGVVVVEDLKSLSAYGLEQSVYAGGYIRGSIDADFLQPLPARTGFEDDRAWKLFLQFLDAYKEEFQRRVEELREKEREKALTELQRRAIELAREILDTEEFRDLELPGGLARSKRPAERERSEPRGEGESERWRDPGDKAAPGGRRFGYEEVPFEDGPEKHSRFRDGRVQANQLNPDYKREMEGPEEAKLAYAALMIGKEIVAYNDRSRACDEYLEKLLCYYFRLKQNVAPRAGVLGKRGRGRPRSLGS